MRFAALNESRIMLINARTVLLLSALALLPGCGGSPMSAIGSITGGGKSISDADRVFLMAAGSWDRNRDNTVTCDEWKAYASAGQAFVLEQYLSQLSQGLSKAKLLVLDHRLGGSNNAPTIDLRTFTLPADPTPARSTARSWWKAWPPSPPPSGPSR